MVYLEELVACVGILDGWNAAIRIDGNERLLLDGSEVHELALIWYSKLL
jgi:hypothetical protein